MDNIGVLHDSLKTQFAFELKDSFEYYFGLLYSVYSMPNIVLPFIGGYMVMKMGVRSTYILFAGLVMIGQFICAFGCQYSSIKTMLFGRVIFGLGGECLNICQNAIIVKWFAKSQLALPMGLTISFSRLGSVLNDILSPRIITPVIIICKI
jgi:MFS family permease